MELAHILTPSRLFGLTSEVLQGNEKWVDPENTELFKTPTDLNGLWIKPRIYQMSHWIKEELCLVEELCVVHYCLFPVLHS